MDDIYLLRTENELLLKQRNMFCNIAKRLYSNITQLYHNSSISEKMHKQMLPFLEMKIEIDPTAFECESIVSETDVKNVTYNYGLEKVNEFLSSKEVEKMISENFPSEEKIKVDIETENQLNTFMKKLHSETKENEIPDFEKISCKDEDTESETSELEDVDCSAFAGTSSVEESEQVGNLTNNNPVLNVCNNDKLHAFRTRIASEQMKTNVQKEPACEPLIETTCEPLVNESACEPNMNKPVCEPLVNEPACEPPQCEKVFHEPKIEKVNPEFVKVKDITYKTLKKEGKLRGHNIEKPCSDSSSCSNSSDESNDSNVKAVLFPKLKNVPNSLFVKSGCSKASTSRLTSIVMKENSECSNDATYSSDGYNNSDDWKSQFRYVSGNLNKNNKMMI